eukprot:8812423-Alexandrium_andersonii.AAC.1
MQMCFQQLSEAGVTGLPLLLSCCPIRRCLTRQQGGIALPLFQVPLNGRTQGGLRGRSCCNSSEAVEGATDGGAKSALSDGHGSTALLAHHLGRGHRAPRASARASL